MALDIGKIRNVAFVGHGGVGKTSLVEGLLHACGATTRLGRVDDGTTTTDFDPDEIKRKISINTAVAYCDYKGHRLNLVDTPGYGDFIADARAGLRVVEAAVVVVDAVAGVQVQTEKVWKFANEYDLPRAIVVNRLDRERADFFRTLESLQKRLKGRLVAAAPADRRGGRLPGFVDLDHDEGARLRPTASRRGAEIPGDLAESVKEYREKLVEAAAETDDDLLAKYLEEGSLGEAEMLKALRARRSRRARSCRCSAPPRRAASGWRPLLDLIVKEFPSPADRGEVEGTDPRPSRRRARARSEGARQRAGVQDALATRTSASCRSSASTRARCGPTARSTTRAATAGSASGTLGWLSGQDPEDGGGARARRDRRGGQAQGHAHRRHALRRGQPFELPRHHLPGAGHLLRHPAQDARRRGQDLDRARTAWPRKTPRVHHHFDPETKQLLVSGMGSSTSRWWWSG